MSRPRLSCAIYTRKSSDEGLEQSFNSLDAQREACEAYIQSQKHEGWQVLNKAYDDGGFSGGNMQRPALQKLMDDIQTGKINVVVVYKVDRLTRSLADFAKMVELFDLHGVSFVSVTQQFNTTSSMGRLTLNVLLSFAQFEREVTGERIRDKIAASKAKGMWMGGVVPLGYCIDNRSLVPIPAEVKKVRHIYERYLTLGSVRELEAELRHDKIYSKSHVTKAGIKTGGQPLARGMLYSLLRNSLYVGQIRHRGKTYPGQHKAIIPDALWHAVQEKLANNRVKHYSGIQKNQSLLTGLLFDEKGERLTPTSSVRSGRRYRYYVLASTTQIKTDARLRLPAGELENLVLEKLRTHLNKKRNSKNHDLLKSLKATDITLQRQALLELTEKIAVFPDQILISLKQGQDLKINYRFSMRGMYKKLENPENSTATEAQKQTLLRALVQGYAMRRKLLKKPGIAIADIIKADSKSHLIRLIHFSFVMPNLASQILNGTIAHDLTREKLKGNFPISWLQQRSTSHNL
jgi:site-specific DNA recombinase